MLWVVTIYTKGFPFSHISISLYSQTPEIHMPSEWSFTVASMFPSPPCSQKMYRFKNFLQQICISESEDWQSPSLCSAACPARTSQVTALLTHPSRHCSASSPTAAPRALPSSIQAPVLRQALEDPPSTAGGEPLYQTVVSVKVCRLVWISDPC